MTNARNMTNPTEIRRFIYAGKASITMESLATGTKIMYEIKPLVSNRNVVPGLWRVRCRTDNRSWYYLSYINMDKDPTCLAIPKKSVFKPKNKQWLAFEMLLRYIHIPNSRENMHMVKITHNGFCGHCGRHLHDELSVQRGFGPVCWEKIIAEFEKEVV